MNNLSGLREYIDRDSGRRVVEADLPESGAVRKISIPLHVLADDLLLYLAALAKMYPDEIVTKDGFRKIREMELPEA